MFRFSNLPIFQYSSVHYSSLPSFQLSKLFRISTFEFGSSNLPPIGPRSNIHPRSIHAIFPRAFECRWKRKRKFRGRNRLKIKDKTKGNPNGCRHKEYHEISKKVGNAVNSATSVCLRHFSDMLEQLAKRSRMPVSDSLPSSCRLLIRSDYVSFSK